MGMISNATNNKYVLDCYRREFWFNQNYVVSYNVVSFIIPLFFELENLEAMLFPSVENSCR